MRKKTLSALLALVLALAPFSALADGANTGTGSDTSTGEPKAQPQVIIVRGDGVEDDTPNAKYSEAYEKAGLTLSEQSAGGAYTLTIDEAKLQVVVDADNTDETYKILENASNPGKLWFGMEYLAPKDVQDIEKALIRFNSEGAFETVNLDNANKNGFYNYIKVYDSSTDKKIGPVQGEIAEIKWLAADDTVLAVTKADVKVVVNTAETPETKYTVTFDSSGGSAVSSASVASGGKVTKPTDPTKAGYTFVNWYKDENCTEAWNFDTDTVTANITLYAKWEAKDDTSDGDDDGQPSEFTITFHANGGTVSPSSGTTKDGKLTTLPTPTRDGYTFDGWFTADSGGAQVTTSTVFEAAGTIYAHWTQKPVTNPDDTRKEYAIWIAPDIRHGDVYVNYQYAEPGTRVTVIVSPDTDYVASWVEVERSNGRLLSLSQNGRRYTFTMPASDVTVTASFRLQTVYSYHTYVNYYEPESPASTAVVPYFAPLTWRPAAGLWDIPAYSWSYAAAQWAYQNGYLDTDADGNFWLTGPVSHQQMWTIMAKWLGAPVTDDRGIASWALQAGAARGTSPASSMTRQNVVEYLYRCWFLMGGDTSVTGNLGEYRDSQLITSASAQSAWLWAVNRGIISGDADGYLNPSRTVTRGEFAVMLMRVCQTGMW